MKQIGLVFSLLLIYFDDFQRHECVNENSERQLAGVRLLFFVDKVTNYLIIKIVYFSHSCAQMSQYIIFETFEKD